MIYILTFLFELPPLTVVFEPHVTLVTLILNLDLASLFDLCLSS